MRTCFNLLLFVLLAQGPETAQVSEKSKYKNALTNIEKLIDNFSEEDLYKNFDFVNKKTGEKKKFNEFSELQKNTFYWLQIERLTARLVDLEKAWRDELKIAKDKENDPKIALKSDIEEFLEQLFELRKKAALNYESFMDKFFTNFAKEFTEDEKKYIMKSIKEFHDKHKLIKRK